MATSVLLILFLTINIKYTLCQTPPFFEWDYALWTKHNQLRSTIANGEKSNQPFATNMEEVLYDKNLESVPLNHALKCNFTYNIDLQKEVSAIKDSLSFKFSSIDQFGENIAWSDNGPLLTFNKLQRIIEKQWFNDIIPYYDYYTSQCNSNQVDCNQYEKLLYGITRYISCGVSICPSLYLNDDSDTIITNAAFIVCNYWPSFDPDQLPIYKTNDSVSLTDIDNNVCTQCSSDRSTECEDGLCSGCPAPNYNYCQDRIIICDSINQDQCDTDAIARLYCPFTCNCNQNDLIPNETCDDLYLSLPTTTSEPSNGPTTKPTITPTNDDICWRLGWYDVPMIETDSSIHCPTGYSLPIANSIQFIQDNCLNDQDQNMLEHQLPVTRIKPYGIAMDWPQYDIGCDWNLNYQNGVISTHSGIKCGDREQLFICIPDHMNTLSPTTSTPTSVTTTTEISIPSLDTMQPTQSDTTQPTKTPTSTDPTTSDPTTSDPTTSGPTSTSPTTAIPTSKEPTTTTTPEPTTPEPTTLEPTTSRPTTSKPITTKSPSKSPTDKPSMAPTNKPTEEPTEIDDTSAPTSAPTSGPTWSPTKEPTFDPTHRPSTSPTLFPSNNPSISPSFQTTFTIDVPATTSVESLNPFKMFLIFPNKLGNVSSNGGIITGNGNSRSLLSVSSDSNTILLYPSQALHLSLSSDCKNNNGIGYQFRVQKPKHVINDRNQPKLKKVSYTIDPKSCNKKYIDVSLIQFRVLSKTKDGDQWIKIKDISYNIKINKEDLIIEMETGITLEYDVGYMFTIDASSLLKNECNDLYHPIYAKSYGKYFKIVTDDLIINEVNPIMILGDGTVSNYQYWMNMSLIIVE